MKQLLFLLLFPCLAMAQYTGNAGQKITLGEQTSADGLVYRGVANDTNVITPFSDTSAYIILDTVNSKFYHYNRTTTYWSLAVGGVTSFSAGTTGLTPTGETTGAVTLGGTLAVANGGTNNTSYISGAVPFSNGTTLTSDISKIFFDNSNNRIGFGIDVPLESFHLRRNFNGASLMRFDNLSTGDAASARVQVINNQETISQLATFGSGFGFNVFGINVANYSVLNSSGTNSNGLILGSSTEDPVIFGTNDLERMRISSDGEVNIGYGATDNGAYKLQVNSQIFATNATIATSDLRFKENIQPLDKGLEIINKLKPVKFNFISTTENNFSEFDEIGFIAQDVEGALSTELFAKAVVKKIDEGKEDSPLGLMTEKLIPILTKAIQEQQALIKALEQRILILENK
jgi:hypothetical protein